MMVIVQLISNTIQEDDLHKTRYDVNLKHYLHLLHVQY